MNKKISPQSIFLALLALAAVLFFISSLVSVKSKDDTQNIPEPKEEGQQQDRHEASEDFSIGKKISIDNENLSGSYPEIIGESLLAKTAREHLQQQKDELQKQADSDLPELRKDFPDAFNDRTYALDIEANILSSDTSTSLVLLEYLYTGGANGISLYTTFTQNTQGKMLALKDVIPFEKQELFMSLVKEQLRNYELPEQGKIELFPEAIDGLSFASLKSFALDQNDLLLYFDKYEVGPGVVGPITLRIDNFATKI